MQRRGMQINAATFLYTGRLSIDAASASESQLPGELDSIRMARQCTPKTSWFVASHLLPHRAPLSRIDLPESHPDHFVVSSAEFTPPVYRSAADARHNGYLQPALAHRTPAPAPARILRQSSVDSVCRFVCYSKDHRTWPAQDTERQDFAEVQIERKQDPKLRLRPTDHLMVAHALQTEFADMNRIVTISPQVDRPR